MKKIVTLISLITIIILLSSCSRPNRGNYNASGKQEQAITVLVQEIQPGDLEKYIKITGKLEGVTDVTMVSETNGKIIKIHKKLGDWINTGESIGSIDNSDYINMLAQAEANYTAAEAGYETAEIQMQVSESLYKKDQISESEFLRAKSSLKSSEALLKGASASVESARKALDNSQFAAPVSGYISEMNLEIGEYISMGNIVANIVNNKQLKIKTGVSESEISYIDSGNEVEIIYNGVVYSAEVSGRGIKPATGSYNYPVEIILDNPGMKLLPGMIVEGRIQAETYRNVIFTSLENLRSKYDNEFVYVINSENRAEIRIVELGEKVSNNVIITSGLLIGDKLVMDGIDSITEGSLVELKSGFELN